MNIAHPDLQKVYLGILGLKNSKTFHKGGAKPKAGNNSNATVFALKKIY